MADPQQTEPTPTPAQPALPDARTVRRNRRARHRRESIAAFVLAARCVCGFAMVLAALVIWFWIAGLPSRATRLILAQLESPGLSITADRVWFDPLEGVKIRNLRAAPDTQTGGAAGPATAREVLLNLSWLNLLAGGPALEGLTIRGGSVLLRLPPEFGTNGLPCDFVLSNINTRVANTWEMYRVEKFTAAWRGGTIEAAGVTVLDAPPSRHRKRASPLDASQRIQAALEKSPPWTRELYRHLAAIETPGAMKLTLEFRQHAAAPELNDLRVKLTGGAALSHGIHVDGYSAEARYTQGILTLPKIELRAEGRTSRVDGTFTTTNQLIELHAVNELPPHYWRNLLPQEWLASLAHTPITIPGRLRSEIWIPPTTLTNIGARWHASIAWDEAQFRDLKISTGSLHVARAGDSFTITHFTAALERDGMTGPAIVDLELDLRTLATRGRLRATADPMLFAPWIPRATREFLRTLAFTSGVPTVDCTFQEGGRSNNTLIFAGPLHATNFTYRGVPLARLDTLIAYSNQHIALAPFHLTRTNGDIRGTLDLDLKREVYSFDLTSTTDPLAIGHLISTQLVRSLAVGRYEGPAKIHGIGTYDNHSPANTEIVVEVDAERIGIQWFLADHATFTLRNHGRQYETTNILATAYDGQTRARFFVYPAPDKTGDRFELDLETRSNDLRRIALSMSPTNKDPTPGRMNLRLQVAGALNDKELATLKGEGRVKITDGELNKVRLFGGLSTLLSKLWTDLGYAKQETLAMTFDIRDGKLTTTDLALDGSLVSVKAKGSCMLYTRRLDFLAEAQLLKKGTLVGETIRFLTTPVTKLLMIQLNGTLAEPEWKNATLDKIF